MTAQTCVDNRWLEWQPTVLLTLCLLQGIGACLDIQRPLRGLQWSEKV